MIGLAGRTIVRDDNHLEILNAVMTVNVRILFGSTQYNGIPKIDFNAVYYQS
jgi:hypothetical protein